MKILHISDTHNRHRQLTNLPETDVVVHSGDVSMNGSTQEILDFLNWFSALPHRHKIFVEGNHDICLFNSKIDGLPDNIYFLKDSSVLIEGVKFYGLSLKSSYESSALDIPEDADVVVSHEPPYGILDFSEGMHYGDGNLMNRLKFIQPKLHLFGHIHTEYGQKTFGLTTFVNSSLLGEGYELVNAAQILKL